MLGVLLKKQMTEKLSYFKRDKKRIDICIICADGDRPSQKRVQAANVIHNVENNKTKTARMAQYLFK